MCTAFDDYCGPEYLQKSAKYITVVLIDTITSITVLDMGGGGLRSQTACENQKRRKAYWVELSNTVASNMSCDVCIFSLSWDKTSWLAQFCFKALPKLTFISDG